MSTGTQATGCREYALAMLLVFGGAVVYGAFLVGTLPLLGAFTHDAELRFLPASTAWVIVAVAGGTLLLVPRLMGRRRLLRLNEVFSSTREATPESYYGPDAVPVRYGLMELAVLPPLLVAPVLVAAEGVSGELTRGDSFIVIFAALLPFCAGYLGRYLMTAVAVPVWTFAAALLLWEQRQPGQLTMTVIAVIGWAVLAGWMYRRYRRHYRGSPRS